MEKPNNEWLKYYSTLPDGGPLYTETNLNHFIVEPWNAISSLAFLVPALYWFIKLKSDYRTHWFLVYCAFWVFVGGMGSTLYHAFRSHRFFILLDFVPMGIVTFSLCLYLWQKLLKKWYLVLSLIPPLFALRLFTYAQFSHHTAINVSYFISGTLFFLPMLLLLWKDRWKNTLTTLGGLALFVLALACRQLDALHPPLLPMGTHFIWHISSAVGCHLIALFVYKLDYIKTDVSSDLSLT